MLRNIVNDYRKIFAEIKAQRRNHKEVEELYRRRAAREELEGSY